ASWCTGANVPLHQVKLESNGKPSAGIDLGHDHAAYELEYNGGKKDGVDLIKFGTARTQRKPKPHPYPYVERSEGQPHLDLATAHGLADNMFSTASTDSFVAHQQIVAGTSQVNSHESLVDVPSAFP